MDSSQIFDALNRGRTQSKQESVQLEVGLESNPSDVLTRIKLLGFYSANPTANVSKYVSHLAWVVKHHSDGDLAEVAITCRLKSHSKKAYYEVRSFWLDALTADPTNARRISNALRFLVVNQDLESAFENLGMLKNAKVNEQDMIGIVLVYEMLRRELNNNVVNKTNYPSEESLRGEAITWCQKAADLETASDWLIASTQLVNLLFESGSLNRAEEAARILLAKASDEAEKHGYALHVGNTVLGKIALIGGSTKAASQHLLDSVNVSDSYLLLSKGPDMTLAQALLEAGDTEIVSRFLDRCKQFKFSPALQTTFDRWHEAIEDGRDPPRIG